MARVYYKNEQLRRLIPSCLLTFSVTFLILFTAPPPAFCHTPAELAREMKHLYFIFGILTGTVVLLSCSGCIWLFNLRRTVKRRAKEIHEGEENLRITLNAIGDGVITTDTEGLIVRINPAAKKITGYSEKTALERPVSEILSIKVLSGSEAFFDPFKTVIEDGGYSIRPDGRILIRQNGDQCRIADTGSPIKDADGKITGVVIVFREVTEDHKMKVRLKKSEKHFRTIMEQSPIGMQIFSKDGTLINVNKTWLSLWNISNPENLIARYNIFRDRQFNAENLLSYFKKAVSGEPAIMPDTEYTAETGEKSATKIIIRSRAFPLMHPDGSFDNIVVFSEDITEDKRIEEELQRAEKLKSLSTLAGGIAHDFNNILTGISGNISLAMESLNENSPARLFMGKTGKSVKRAIHLAGQLLTFAEGGAPISRAIDLFSLAESSVSFELSGSNVRPVFSYDGSPAFVMADKNQFRQVFACITQNANQAMPDGGCLYVDFRRVELEIGDVSGLIGGEYIRIDFRDEGTGIKEENIDRIFDPFFSTKPGGTGMGLAAAYSILLRHNGAVTVSSEYNEGALFSLFVPATEAPAEPEQVINSKPAIPSEKIKGKILVMDDESIIRSLASAMLKRFDYTPVTASDGEEAILLFRNAIETGEPFQAVIMDLTVPGGMGGKETVREILDIDPTAVCIVSSGYAADPVISDYKKFGFKGAVAKPYTISELRRTLDEILNVF